MSPDNNQFNGTNDIAQFLEKFREPDSNAFKVPAAEPIPVRDHTVSQPSAQYEYSLGRLERKIQELEEKFDASELQNEFILSELSQTREALKHQKDRDAFMEHLSASIASLKASVEKLTQAQQNRSFALREPEVQRGFDVVTQPAGHMDINQYQPDNYREVQYRRRQEQDEKDRIISSLHQKTSQLKAVSSALDREIKKVQQEKMEALKKSAEQAKEILFLRDQLTAAQERFKSFNFEGRIISIRQEYQQRVTHLETQLQEISDTCMKQVEEIESLRTENLKLQQAAAQKEQTLHLLEEKEQELQALKAQVIALQKEGSAHAQQQKTEFTKQIHELETQRDQLSAQLQAAQQELDAVRNEQEQSEKNFKALLDKINSNDAVIEQLKQKIEVLGRQNETLARHNSRLVQENRALAGQQAQLKKSVQETDDLLPKKPSLLPKNQLPSAVPLKPFAPTEKNSSSDVHSFAQPATALPPLQQETISKPAGPISARPQVPGKEMNASAQMTQESSTEHPVEIARQAKVKVQTEADLPEIKVADPIPQPASLFEGEDFLMKTDNFIGRIKWSIFREDR